MTTSRTNSSNLTNNFTSLNLAIGKLIDKQEKDWGYFQVKKEEEFYSLHLPFLPCLRLYQRNELELKELDKVEALATHHVPS